jgi:hypothetical protein
MKKMSMAAPAALLLSLVCGWSVPAAAAEEAYGEVVAVAGDVQLTRKGQASAPLAQGTMIEQGDRIAVGPASSADLAFDPAWENTARLNSNTLATVQSLAPVKLNMVSGDIYSKLERLAAGSSFEVKTPTAVAVVRGTRFRTTHQSGMTTVYNDSETSMVYVYHLDENGNRSGRAIVLKPGESISVAGEAEVYDSPLDELEEGRDREDQDQLNEELSRERFSQPNETPQEGNFNGNF